MADIAVPDGITSTIQSKTHIPIAQLTPLLAAPSSRSLKATVTLTWPYSSATGSVAFLLAEPDFRLRRNRGQVRVQFSGSSAQAVAKSGIASGDEVIVCLDGVQWLQDVSETAIPGSGVEVELKFTERLLLQFRQDNSQDAQLIDIDHPEQTQPSQLAAENKIPSPESADAPTLLSPSRNLLTPEIENDEWASPAFVKRARTSYGSLLGSGYDLFEEEDGTVPGKGRKRAKSARKSRQWRYASRSPTPDLIEEEEAEDLSTHDSHQAPEQVAPAMVNEASQTEGLEVADAGEILAEFTTQPGTPSVIDEDKKAHTTDAGAKSNAFGHNESPGGANQLQQSMLPLSIPRVQIPDTEFLEERLDMGRNQMLQTGGLGIAPLSPRLRPLPSDGLPLVSPLVETKSGVFGAPEAPTQPRFGPNWGGHITSISQETQEARVDEDIYNASPLRNVNEDVPALKMASAADTVFENTVSMPGIPPTDTEAQYGKWQGENDIVSRPFSPYKVQLGELEALNQESYTNQLDDTHQTGQHYYSDHEMPASERVHYPELGEANVRDHGDHSWDIVSDSVQYPDLTDPGLVASDTYPAERRSASRPATAAMSRSHSVQSPTVDLTEDSDEEDAAANQECEETDQSQSPQTGESEPRSKFGHGPELVADEEEEQKDKEEAGLGYGEHSSYRMSELEAEYESEEEELNSEVEVATRPELRDYGFDDDEEEYDSDGPHRYEDGSEDYEEGYEDEEEGYEDEDEDMEEESYQAPPQQQGSPVVIDLLSSEDEEEPTSKAVPAKPDSVDQDNLLQNRVGQSPSDEEDEEDEEEEEEEREEEEEEEEQEKEEEEEQDTVTHAEAPKEDSDIHDEQLSGSEDSVLQPSSELDSEEGGYLEDDEDMEMINPPPVEAEIIKENEEDMQDISDDNQEEQDPSQEVNSPENRFKQTEDNEEHSSLKQPHSQLRDSKNSTADRGVNARGRAANPEDLSQLAEPMNVDLDGSTTYKETLDSEYAVRAEESPTGKEKVPEAEQETDEVSPLVAEFPASEHHSKPATLYEEHAAVTVVLDDAATAERIGEGQQDLNRFMATTAQLHDAENENQLDTVVQPSVMPHPSDLGTATTINHQLGSLSEGTNDITTRPSSRGSNEPPRSHIGLDGTCDVYQPEVAFPSISNALTELLPPEVDQETDDVEVPNKVEARNTGIYLGEGCQETTAQLPTPDDTQKSERLLPSEADVPARTSLETTVSEVIVASRIEESPNKLREEVTTRTIDEKVVQVAAGPEPINSMAGDLLAASNGNDSEEDPVSQQLMREERELHSPVPAAIVLEEEISATTTTRSGYDLVKQSVAGNTVGSSVLQAPTTPVRRSARNAKAVTPGSVNSTFSVILDDDPTPRGHDASIELAMSALESPTQPTHEAKSPGSTLKLRLTKALRTELADFTALKLLRYNITKKLDVLAIATTSTPEPQRAKNGPRHYQISFKITDASIGPSHVIEVQVFRPYKDALPIVKEGDGVLLRNFPVQSIKGGFSLRSDQSESSSWAVYKGEANVVEVRGPPVEYGDGELHHIETLKTWYEGLDSISRAKLERANGDKGTPTPKSRTRKAF